MHRCFSAQSAVLEFVNRTSVCVQKETRLEMVIAGVRPQDEAAMREAGKQAVRLLKQMAAMLPLRSDTPQIKEEIARIEKIFGRDDPQ